MTDDAPPSFERPFEGEDAEHRVYGAVLHAREPTTVREIAELADCSDEAARSHLSFYAELRIVIRHEGRPVRYERNEEYFKWRQATRLAEENTVDELQARVSELTTRIEEYRVRYDADSPAAVDVLEFSTAQIDDVYTDLSDWTTALEERQLYERARKKAAESTAPSRS